MAEPPRCGPAALWRCASRPEPLDIAATEADLSDLLDGEVYG
jgi:hypothetical protein